MKKVALKHLAWRGKFNLAARIYMIDSIYGKGYISLNGYVA